MLFSRISIILILSSQIISATPILSIIVSNNSKIDSISKTKIKNLFLSKTKEFSNGQKAITVEPNNNEYNSLFYEKISGKSKKQLKKYWANMIFTGRGFPPKKISDVYQLIEYIKQNPNAIGYVPNSSIKNQDVKVLLNIQ